MRYHSQAITSERRVDTFSDLTPLTGLGNPRIR
jgi:hypothetical protein